MKKLPRPRGSLHNYFLYESSTSLNPSKSGRIFLFQAPGYTGKSAFAAASSYKKRDFRRVSDRPQALYFKEEITMEFFNSAIEVLQTLVVALGAGLGVWGGVNLLEGYGSDNPGSNAHVP